MIAKLAVVSSSPLFDMLSNKELEEVASVSKPLHFDAGQVVFEEGELGDSLYVIVNGDVEVVQRIGTRAQVIAELSPPEFFGEMSLIDKEYRSATVRAKSEAELLKISSEDLTSFRQQNPAGFTMIVLNIARVLSARLRVANQRIVPLPGKGAL